MINKKLLVVLAPMLTLALLSGCISSVELNELALVMGVAIDREADYEQNEYMVTVQIAKPSSLKTGENEGSGNRAYTNYSQRGVGVDIPVNALSNRVNRKLYMGHNQVLVVGSEAAKSDISALLDFLLRGPDGRYTVSLFIARGSAKDTFDIKTELDHIPAGFLKNLTKSYEKYGEYSESSLRDFLSDTLISTKSPTVPILEVITEEDGDKEVMITGAAVFKDGRMCAELSKKQSQAVRILSGDGEGGLIELSDSERYVSLKISRSDARYSARFDGERFSGITAEVTLGCSIIDTNINGDLLSEQAREKLKEQAEAHVIEQLSSAIAHTKACGADVFGFGEYLYRYHTQETEDLRENWETEYKNLSIDTKVTVDILSFGSILHPLRPETGTEKFGK